MTINDHIAGATSSPAASSVREATSVGARNDIDPSAESLPTRADESSEQAISPTSPVRVPDPPLYLKREDVNALSDISFAHGRFAGYVEAIRDVSQRLACTDAQRHTLGEMLTERVRE